MATVLRPGLIKPSTKVNGKMARLADRVHFTMRMVMYLKEASTSTKLMVMACTDTRMVSGTKAIGLTICKKVKVLKSRKTDLLILETSNAAKRMGVELSIGPMVLVT